LIVSPVLGHRVKGLSLKEVKERLGKGEGGGNKKRIEEI